MSTVTAGAGNPASENVDVRTDKMPFWLQVTTLTWRHLKINVRQPSNVLPPIFIGAFFLLVYEAALGGAADFIPDIEGAYIGFIAPLSIVSSSLSGAGISGQSIVRDIENGYFDKLMLTPFSRGALVLGPTFAGAIFLAVQAAVILAVGVLLGLWPVTGFFGLVAVVINAMLLGLSFAGLMIAVALWSGNASATQSANFLFFPLTFLSETFVPIDLLQGWLQVVATYNPITYVLQGMRAVINQGWAWDTILLSYAVCLVTGAVTFAFCLYALRRRTSRQ
jgi:ABC-2 type transport system permease protein